MRTSSPAILVFDDHCTLGVHLVVVVQRVMAADQRIGTKTVEDYKNYLYMLKIYEFILYFGKDGISNNKFKWEKRIIIMNVDKMEIYIFILSLVIW